MEKKWYTNEASPKRFVCIAIKSLCNDPIWLYWLIIYERRTFHTLPPSTISIVRATWFAVLFTRLNSITMTASLGEQTNLSIFEHVLLVIASCFFFFSGFYQQFLILDDHLNIGATNWNWYCLFNAVYICFRHLKLCNEWSTLLLGRKI